jgi:hypothetical protein
LNYVYNQGQNDQEQFEQWKEDNMTDEERQQQEEEEQRQKEEEEQQKQQEEEEEYEKYQEYLEWKKEMSAAGQADESNQEFYGFGDTAESSSVSNNNAATSTSTASGVMMQKMDRGWYITIASSMALVGLAVGFGSAMMVTKKRAKKGTTSASKTEPLMEEPKITIA